MMRSYFLSVGTLTLTAAFADLGDAFVSPVSVANTVATTSRLYEDVVNGADVYPPNAKSAFDRYKETYAQSIEDPESFWGEKVREEVSMLCFIFFVGLRSGTRLFPEN